MSMRQRRNVISPFGVHTQTSGFYGPIHLPLIHLSNTWSHFIFNKTAHVHVKKCESCVTCLYPSLFHPAITSSDCPKYMYFFFIECWENKTKWSQPAVRARKSKEKLINTQTKTKQTAWRMKKYKWTIHNRSQFCIWIVEMVGQDFQTNHSVEQIEKTIWQSFQHTNGNCSITKQ